MHSIWWIKSKANQESEEHTVYGCLWSLWSTMRTRISIKLPRANPCLGRSISSCASCPAFHARRCSWVPIHGPSIRIHLRCFDVAFMDPTDPNSGSPVPTADFFQFLEHLRTMFDRLQPALALTKRAVNNRHTDSKFGDLLGLWRWLFFTLRSRVLSWVKCARQWALIHDHSCLSHSLSHFRNVRGCWQRLKATIGSVHLHSAKRAPTPRNQIKRLSTESIYELNASRSNGALKTFQPMRTGKPARLVWNQPRNPNLRTLQKMATAYVWSFSVSSFKSGNCSSALWSLRRMEGPEGPKRRRFFGYPRGEFCG